MKGKLIWLILGVAFLLRFVFLSGFPVGFNADEASNGYDAYSLLRTGRDQWGTVLPLVLKSFGDFKAPLYTYLTVLSVAVFGLNVFAVRLPNVIIGTIAILVVYLLTNKIFSLGKLTTSKWPGIIAALLLAINPWSVMMSRGAFESNLITLLVPLGIYLFLKGLEKPKYLSYSAISFGLSFFAYHSAKLIAPMIIVALIAISFRKLRNIKFKKLILPGLIMGIFTVGLVYTFLIGGGSRVAERSITSGAIEAGAVEKIKLIQAGMNPILAKALHNKYQVVAERFLTNYIQYFSGKFLLTKGAGDATYGMRPGIGVIYIVEGLLLLGLIPMFIKKDTRKLTFLLLFWLLITPLPAALATGIGYSGNRAMGMIPVLQILGSLGAFGWWGFLSRMNNKNRYLIVVLFFVALTFSVSRFVKAYTSSPSELVLNQMLYGRLDAGAWLSQNVDGKKVIVSRSLSEPQIYIAFASLWDPTDYQKNTESWDLAKDNTVWIDQLPEWSLGNFTFRSIDQKNDFAIKDTIIVGRPEEFPEDVSITKTINYPDGTPNILIVENH
jgi:4-amino-4-deoxy-L-arabinose transferase-like glycosyltransferase